MSSKAKVKGTRVENEIVKLFQAEGFNARRQPLSGAIQAFPHDVQVKDLFDGTNVEVKARKNGEGFTQLDKWKGSADLLVLKKDRTSPMICMDWEQFKLYLHAAKTNEGTEEGTIQENARRGTGVKRQIRNGGGQNRHIKARFGKRPFRHKFPRPTEVEEDS